MIGDGRLAIVSIILPSLRAGSMDRDRTFGGAVCARRLVREERTASDPCHQAEDECYNFVQVRRSRAGWRNHEPSLDDHAATQPSREVRWAQVNRVRFEVLCLYFNRMFQGPRRRRGRPLRMRAPDLGYSAFREAENVRFRDKSACAFPPGRITTHRQVCQTIRTQDTWVGLRLGSGYS